MNDIPSEDPRRDEERAPDPIADAAAELDQTGVEHAATETAMEREGDRIGRYKLLEQIGTGGMGTVWMAEQLEPVQRKVALKIIKLGMDTKEVVTRFEAERQALALMDHPHIAKVLDGGSTATGRPYFVMELVRGVTITEFCDANRLGLRQRLELFAKVCEALQHAHLKGVVHRDVKPSNVLVTLHDGTPVPKVIDFGIAKATSAELTQKTLFTRYAQLIGTPEYMAPEQAELSGLDIDTRADVYSLGVLLYELLTGTTPFDMREVLERGYSELLRTIREETPAKPSTRVSTLGESLSPIARNRHVNVDRLSSRLRGDLDWIVMKALEKERGQRYETASAFADDVGRFLRGEEVLAAPPSRIYRLRKFVARRRRVVAVTAIIALLLVGGTVGTGIGLFEARDANAKLRDALDEKEKQRLAAVDSADRATRAERKAVQRAREVTQVSEFQSTQLREMKPQVFGATLRRELLARVPEEDREAFSASLRGLNFTDMATTALSASLYAPTASAIETQFPTQPLIRAELLLTLGQSVKQLGRYQDAKTYLTESLQLRRKELGDDAAPAIVAMLSLAEVLGYLEEYEGAATLLEEARDHAEARHGTTEIPVLVRRADAVLLMQRQQTSEALPLLQGAVPQLEQRLGGQSDLTLSAKDMLMACLSIDGDFERAETLAREILEASIGNVGEDGYEAAHARSQLGQVLTIAGQHEAALAELERSNTLFVEMLGADHPMTISGSGYLVNALAHLERFDEAIALGRANVEAAERVLPEEDQVLRRARSALAIALEAKGSFEEAAELTEDVAEGASEAELPSTSDIISMILRGNLQKARGQIDEAEASFKEAIEKGTPILGEDNHQLIVARAGLAVVLGIKGRYDEAIPLMRRSIVVLEEVYGEDHRNTLIAIDQLGVLLRDNGDFEESAACYATILERTEGRGERAIIARFNLGMTRQFEGRVDEAEELINTAIEELAGRFGADHPIVQQMRTRALGVALKREQYAFVIEEGSQLLERVREKQGHNPPERFQLLQLIALAKVHRARKGETGFSDAIDAWQGIADFAAESLPTERWRALVALGGLQVEDGRFEAAERTYRTALELPIPPLNSLSWLEPLMRSGLGTALSEQGRHAEAEPIQLDAVTAMLDPEQMPLEFQVGHDRLGIAMTALIRTLEARQQAEPTPERAAALRDWKQRLETWRAEHPAEPGDK